MCANFSDERAVKRSSKVRGGRPPVGRARVPVFELLEQREMLSGNTYTAAPSASAPDSTAAYNSSSSTNSLRSAIAAANADTGTATDIIDLSAGTYTLSLKQLEITSTAHTLIIDGQGPTTIIDQTALDRVFEVDNGVTVVFENLEITGGTAETDYSGGTAEAEGGGILNLGSLTLNNVAVVNNTAQATLADESAFGGGIFSVGALTINGLTSGASQIAGNSATGFGGTDGVDSGDGGFAEGGGIYSSTNAQLQISGTTIANNTAAGGAGAPFTGGEGDDAGFGIGGGLYTAYNDAAPTTLLNDDTISGNEAIGGNGGNGAAGQNGGVGGYAYGGGIAAEYANSDQSVTGLPIVISNSTISGNVAQCGTGGAAGAGGSSGGTDGAFGGGIENDIAGMELLNDTIAGNAANGGIGYTAGGGIDDDSLGMFLLNVTIAHNTAQAAAGSTSYGGGIDNDGSYDTDLQLENTLVADNTAGTGTDFYGTVAATQDNLIGNGTGSSGFSTTNGDQVGTSASPINPQLGALASNGGSTETYSLLAGSAAIATGDSTLAASSGLTTDQRGLPRTTAGKVDIGAYQVQATAATTSTALTASAGSASAGQSVTFTAVVSAAPGVTAAPTGSVEFEIDNVAAGTGTLSVVNGVDEATFSTSSLTAGAHVITAVYQADPNFQGSTSPLVNENITSAGATDSSTTISADPDPVSAGQSVTFTALVTPGAGATATPTGTVVFEVDGVVVGSGALSGVVGLDDATSGPLTLAAGSHTVTAVYSGDSNFNGNVSPSIYPVVVSATYGTPVVTGATTTAENAPISGIVIAPAAGDSTVTSFQITGITGGTLYYDGGTAPIVSGQFITVASAAAGLEFIPTTNSVATASFTVQESTTADSGGLVGTTAIATIGIAGTRTVPVASYYNVTGITSDGTSFGTGIDGQNNALSGTVIGTSVTWDGIAFTIGAANVNNVIQSVGQTIALPAGTYSSVSFLAVGTNGNQPNQQFIIHYSDGTSTTVTQSVSDWATPQGYAGESVALTTGHRNTSNGGSATGTFDVYGYSLAVNPAKTVESITLPNDAKVKLLSIATQATLDAPTNLAATAVSGNVNLAWTASDSAVTSYNVYRYTIGNASTPTLVGSGVTATNYTDTTAMAGNTYYYVVKAVNGTAIAFSPASNVASAMLASQTIDSAVDLTGQYNLAGITSDGISFSGGLDGHGNSLSATEVGTSTTWNNVNFNIAPAGANNVIQATGQAVTLPPGSYSAIDLLATGVNGNQANQTFQVNYTDGTSTTIIRSLSDWASPQSYAGESVALATGYRNTAGGGRTTGTFNVYGYSLAVNGTKTVASITLPNSTNVDVLAISVVAAVAAPTNLTVTAASSTAADLSWTAAAGTITGYNVYRGTTAGGESTTPINSSPLSASATSYVDTTAVGGNSYYYVVKAIDGLASSPTSKEVGVAMPTSGAAIPINLTNAYNVPGITSNGTTFSGGLDGNGNALSATQLGTSIAWNGIAFAIGPANVNDVVEGSGQTIALPAGNYSNISLLAVGTNGNQLNQQFTINYSDGTSTTVTQSFSDWGSPQGFAGESVALSATFRNTSTGGQTAGAFDVYGYSLATDPTKTVESITLPNSGYVKILSMAVQATLDAPSNLAAATAVNGNVSLTWTASTSQVTGYDVYRYTVGNASSPTLLASGVTATNYTDATSVAGNTYFYVVTAVNSSAVSPDSNIATATAANTATTTKVDLTGDYNLTGITDDTADFLSGLDGNGNALSATEVGSGTTWDGANFNFAPPGANNVIQATGQTIALPSGSYSAVDLVATGVNGSQSNQTFTVNYTDGTSTTISQSLSDWSSPQGYAGESVALTSAYRNTSNGGRTSGTFDVYGYTIGVDSTKTVASITLPNNSDVVVLAIDVVDPVAAPTNLTVTAPSSSAADLSWTAATGTVAGYNVYRGTVAGGESATPINGSPLSATATSYTDTTALAGTTYYYVVKAINGSAISLASNEAGVAMPISGSAVAVDLGSDYNVTAVTTNGTSETVGLDNQGNTLSEAEVGTSVRWNGITFPIGAPNVNNAVQGSTITLPAGNYSSVSFLAVGNSGNQLNQQFTINYSDGTSTTVTQSLSDWGSPQGYAGESIALATTYRNTSTGGQASGTFDIYGYTFAVNPFKTVESITLPDNGNVKVLSMVAQATLDAATNLTATAASNGDVNLTWTASDSTISGYSVYRYTAGSAASPTLLANGVSATNYTDTTGVPGNTYYYVVKAVTGSAASPDSNAASATVLSANPVTTEVDLTGQYNLTGITSDGAGFSVGLDGQGNALSATELGTGTTWSGANFYFASAGANNVIQATGQTITLPAGLDSAVDLLATAVNGSQANQTFTVTYTDGTSTTITQSLSDWAAPQGYAGESVALTTGYRNTSKGGRDTSTFNVYGYSLATDGTKTIASITLPNDKNVEVLAISVVDPAAAPTNLTVTAASSTVNNLSWTGVSAGTITGYNVYRGMTVGGESTTPINSSPLSATATSYSDTTAVAGNTYYYVVKAVDGPALSSASNEAGVTMPATASTIPVDLGGQYNLAGITVNGAKFSGGLDGQGNALSETEVGTSQNFAGVNFNIAPATTPASNNVVQATGQTIGLPSGSYSRVDLLATAVNGSQTNQTFTVNFSDGTSDSYSLNLSDWYAPQGFSDEGAVVESYYRNTSNGGGANGDFYVYGYSLILDTTKTVESVTLPNDKNVEVLAMTVVNPTAAVPLLTASDNTPNTFTLGTSPVPVDSRVTLSSADADLTSATVAISPGTLQTGDLLIFNNQNGITGSYDAASGVLSLTGTASVADYQAALQSVLFSTTSTDTTTRSLTIVASDNLLTSNTVSETVAV
ncbi:MAG TPA: fibronectin type III domain-containing protein [Pirellulales bacterium]|nr:fibronectin type III domain-containing protein [Pirellulales bacterium]